MDLPQIDKDTSFAVLGLGKFGMSIARELCENGYNVLCCDRNASFVNEIAEIATSVVQADVSEPNVLASLGMGNFDIVVIAFSDDFEAELLTTMIVKEMGVPFVLAKATGPRQKKILENVGADKVVMPETEMGQRVANNFITNDPMEFIHRSEHYDIVEMGPKRDWIGKSLEVLDLRKNESLNILTIIRDDTVLPNLTAKTIIEKNDRLIALQII
ncbi:MAG: potassium channel family protein [Oscillospiraceae bacterium]